MSNKQARLVAAISDAMAAQGFSQNNLARVSGVAQSMISAAILGKCYLKEEKWRLLCEALDLDYDEIVAEAQDMPSPVQETVEAPVTEVTEVTEETSPAALLQQNEAPCCENAASCDPVKKSGGVSWRSIWKASCARICAPARICPWNMWPRCLTTCGR